MGLFNSGPRKEDRFSENEAFRPTIVHPGTRVSLSLNPPDVPLAPSVSRTSQATGAERLPGPRPDAKWGFSGRFGDIGKRLSSLFK